MIHKRGIDALISLVKAADFFQFFLQKVTSLVANICLFFQLLVKKLYLCILNIHIIPVLLQKKS